MSVKRRPPTPKPPKGRLAPANLAPREKDSDKSPRNANGHWVKGTSGNPSGRKKGTTLTRHNQLHDRAAELKLDPVQLMLEVAAEFRADALLADSDSERRELLKDAVDIASGAAPYMYAKLASIEMHGDNDAVNAHLHAHIQLDRMLDLDQYNDDQVSALRDLTRAIAKAKPEPKANGSTIDVTPGKVEVGDPA